MNRKILVVDDRANTLKVLGAILEDEGYEILRAQSGSEALSVMQDYERVDAVLADLKMPEMDGLELFHRMQAMRMDIPFIIMTAYGTVESAVEALKEGVTHYLIKPLNYEELSFVLERAFRLKKVSDELDNLRLEIQEKYSFQNIIGTHPGMKQIFETIKTVAPTDASILIHGETGTGKELLAKAIHTLSRRHEKPMVSINSAALAESLLEAELFGYIKGSFTGAISNKPGRLEAADGGTLFLDEIGHMSLNVQTKLLRFLENGAFEPVGGVETRYVNVRIVAASNVDLRNAIENNRFLSDLLYRIEVISIDIPPLRERGDDIILLANHFIRLYSGIYHKEVQGITPEAMDLLMKYNWPGNIRELENCIARSVIMAKGDEIQKNDLPEKIKGSTALPKENYNGFIRGIPDQGIKLKEIERELIIKTIEKAGGNKSKTAQMLGVSRKALYEKIERYSIE